MNLAYLVVGICMLILGRKFFWLFTGGIGFFIGYSLAPKLLPNQSGNVILIIAVVLGLLGIFLAVFIKSTAISIAGFAAGAYVIYALLPMLHFDLGNYYWLVIIVGGVCFISTLAIIIGW